MKSKLNLKILIIFYLPHGSSFLSLLFSEHILHSWNDDPIFVYISYCSLDIWILVADVISIAADISIITSDPFEILMIIGINFEVFTFKNKMHHIRIKIQVLLLSINKSLNKWLWNSVKYIMVSCYITNGPLTQFCTTKSV